VTDLSLNESQRLKSNGARFSHVRLWLPVVAWAAMIFTLSSMPFDAPPTTQGLIERYKIDKVVHLIMFGILSALVLRALRERDLLPLRVALALAVVVTSAYGASDEWHQMFVPNRYPSVSDWVADTLGAGLAAVLYYRYESRRSTKTNR
jgi:VanZ family protein